MNRGWHYPPGCDGPPDDSRWQRIRDWVDDNFSDGEMAEIVGCEMHEAAAMIDGMNADELDRAFGYDQEGDAS